ncbi:MAG TPA: ATP-dependent helicase [Clostridiales bacterium UBA8153]|nr:ATP-dependent helicase [Clostridiales bacterium UBA8153]
MVIDCDGGNTATCAHAEEVLAWLPTRAGQPIPSSPLIAGSPWEPGEAGRPEVDPKTQPHGPEVVLAPWTLPALPLTPAQALELLCCAGDRQVLAPGLVVGKDLAFWARALRLAGGLVARQQYLPGLATVPAAGATTPVPTVYRACWEPVLAGADGDQLLRLARMMPPVARGLSGPAATSPPGIPAVELLRQFTGDMVDCLVRLSLNPTAIRPEPAPARSPSARDPARSGSRSAGRAKRKEPGWSRDFHSIHDYWLYALRAADGRMEGNADELARLAAEIGQWRHPVTLAASSPFRLCFRLEEPEAKLETGPPSALDTATGAGWDTAGPTGSDRWFVRYLLQAVDDPSLLIPVLDAWNGSKRKAGVLARVDASVREYVLLALGQCGGICPEIATSLKAELPAGYELDAAGAHQFLTQGAASLELAGFGVMLPAWWSRKGTKLQLRVRASAKSPTMRGAGGLSLGSIVEVHWQVALGDQTLTYTELQALAQIKAPLVRVRGQWVHMNSEAIAAALAFWTKRGANATASARELLCMSLGAGGPAGGVTFEGVSATGWVGDILDRLDGRVSFEEVPVPAGFAGTLRPYQVRGYSWLSYLSQWGLGACLADDMGLGKTVQTLALIQRDWEATGGASHTTVSAAARPVLLICPTSVVGNWQKEAARFVPDLPVLIHHGASRETGAAFVKVAERHALVITSYSLLQRDVDLLRQISWAGIVLDEAQNIKNPETKQAQAARALPEGYRLALTGTPVENSVADLWSIMEFLNPGFLGTREQFRREFFIPIQAGGDLEASKRLQRITGPFILRRLKTDRAIIADLPDKLEAKIYCTLTREQASLYAAVVNEAEGALESAEGIQRKGVILATLSKLKQVCNHPAQFLGDHSAIPGRSGKLARLTEMLEEMLTVGDRALVFTQFAEMGDILRRHLQETFGREVLFLHGGVPKAKRDWMVERFQAGGDNGGVGQAGGPAIFILSVKAGGTGLNLTAANHVFHFDRWWNPAVENQATDRAFRIGQLRNVQVHKFVCAGTLEEKIDELIERKRALAEEVVGAGEGWLTRLSNQALREIFTLRNQATEE